MSITTPDTFLFDLAGVLIRWDPQPLYLEIFGGDQAEVDRFLSEVISPPYQDRISRGQPTRQILDELSGLHPRYTSALDAWWDRWDEMLPASFDATVSLTRELRHNGYRTCILGNWGREELDRARPRFDFLDEFDGVVISGDVGALKPEPAIYAAAIDRLRLEPSRTLFVDDKAENIEGARAQGMSGHVFTGAGALREHLQRAGVELGRG